MDKLIKENANARDQLADDLIKVKMDRDSQSVEDLLADLSIKDDKISTAPKQDEKETEKVRTTSKLIPPERSRKQNLESQKTAGNRTHTSSTAKVTSESSEKNNSSSGLVAIKKQGISRAGSALSKEKTNLRNEDRASESTSSKPKSNIKKQR